MVKPDLFWSRESELELDSFLGARKPSMIKDDGSKPWIWVQKESSGRAATNEDVEANTLSAATAILASVTDRIKEIETDPTIPTRANKSKGTRSKKDLREEAQAEAAESLKTLSIESGETVGKWLLFRDGARIDPTFATLARSLINGPLSKTRAHLMKVATCPFFDSDEHYQHVICIYYPNVYDEADSKLILKIAAEEHGIELSSVKSDVYTKIGLDSKHESKMRSTIWQPKELGYDKDTLKTIIEAYWEKQKSEKAGGDDVQDEDGNGATTKRKAAGPTPDEVKATKKTTAKRAKATFADDNDSASSGDEDKKPIKPAVVKKTAPATKASTKSKAKKTFEDGDDSSEEEPDVKPKVKPASKAKSTTVEPASRKGKVEEKVEAKKAELSGSETEPE